MKKSITLLLAVVCLHCNAQKDTSCIGVNSQSKYWDSVTKIFNHGELLVPVITDKDTVVNYNNNMWVNHGTDTWQEKYKALIYLLSVSNPLSPLNNRKKFKYALKKYDQVK